MSLRLSFTLSFHSKLFVCVVCDDLPCLLLSVSFLCASVYLSLSHTTILVRSLTPPSFADVYISSIKYYHVFKLVFLTWCFLPLTRVSILSLHSPILHSYPPLSPSPHPTHTFLPQGSHYTYHYLIRPHLKPNEEVIDSHLLNARDMGVKATGEIGRLSKRLAHKASRNVAQSIMQTISKDMAEEKRARIEEVDEDEDY